MEHAYIIDGRRSYIGVENGMYKHLPAEVLAAEVLCALVPVDVRQTVDEVIVGNGVGASGNVGIYGGYAVRIGIGSTDDCRGEDKKRTGRSDRGRRRG